MTATAPIQTLYAPNPPQIDEPWLKYALILVIIALTAALACGM